MRFSSKKGVCSALILLAASSSLLGQEQTVLEIEIATYRAERVPMNPYVCPDGKEVPVGSRLWVVYDAEVEGIISGEFGQERVSFAATSALNYQCIELMPLPAGAEGQRLRDLGADFQAEAAYCGDFRPRCEPDASGVSATCFWDGWWLPLNLPTGEPPAPEPPRTNVELKERFLETRDFVLVESLRDLPADVQERLPRWDEDGTFAIAEKGEYWSAGDVVLNCSPLRKHTEHWISGISGDLAAVFFRSSGVAVQSNVRIVDRRTGANLICRIDEEAMRQWNGLNQVESMFQYRNDELVCWSERLDR